MVRSWPLLRRRAATHAGARACTHTDAFYPRDASAERRLRDRVDRALRSNFRAPRIALLLRLRALVLAGRAVPAVGEGAPPPACWVCATAPLWALQQIVGLLA